MADINCPSNAELRAFQLGEVREAAMDQIADHLEQCPRCEERARALDSLTDQELMSLRHQLGTATRVVTSVAALPAGVRLPDRIGVYDVLSELGRGGMGVVYRAWHPQLERVVALKMMLHGRFADMSARERFHSEAAALARMQHPNIVQIFEAGVHEGQPYFTLEYVSRGSLRERLGHTPLDPRQAAAWAETLARAVEAAHQQGIIHRDLKPNNVLLTEEGLLKITDFGLAKLLDGSRGQTTSGLVVGTPEYMAPEQATEGGSIGPATDVYSLGVVLYEMLAGRPPFHAPNPLDTLKQVCAQEPVPPSRLQPRLPADLETICLKCLQKEPRRRYSSAAELAEDLRRFLGGEPILARPTPTLVRAVKWARRRPAVSGLLAAVVLVTVLGFAGVLWKWNEEVVQRRRAEGLEREALQVRDDALRDRDRAETGVYFSRVAQARLLWRLDNDVAGAASLLAECEPAPGQTDRRGWEWYYLKGLNHAELATFRGHSGPFVHALAYSPDGKTITSAGGGNPFYATQPPVKPGEVILWDAQTHQPRCTLGDHGHLVVNVAYSPDGSRLASACLDDTVRIWDTTASPPKVLRRFPGSPAVAFSPDSKRIATGREGAVAVVDVESAEEVRTLSAGSFSAYRVAFSPDGKTLAAGSWARQDGALVCVWDLATGARKHTLRVPSLRVDGLAFSPDGRFLAAAAARALVWEVESGRQVHTLGPANVLNVAFSPDGLDLAGGVSDRTVRVWDVLSGTERIVLRGHRGRVSAVAFDPSGWFLAAGDEQPGDVKLWDLTQPVEYTVHPTRSSRPTEGLAFNASGTHVLTTDTDGILKELDIATGKLGEQRLGVDQRPMVPASRVAFDVRGSRVAAVPRSRTTSVTVWDTATSAEKCTVTFPAEQASERVCWVRINHDGSRLAAGTFSRDGTTREVRTWDTDGGRLRFSTRMPARPIGLCRGGLALSGDGRWVAYDQPDTDRDDSGMRIHVCDAGSGTSRTVLRSPGKTAAALAFSADGRLLAEAAADGCVRVWDVATATVLHTEPMREFAQCLAFSPDGKRLVAVTREEVKLWDTGTGQEVLVLYGAPARPGDNAFNPEVAWSPDGQRLAAINWNGTISVWDAGDRATPKARAAVQRQAQARKYALHLDRADQTLSQAPSAFAFHWQQVLSAPPPTEPTLRRLRGNLFARQGQWSQAAADLENVAAAQPDDASALADLACMRFLAGDVEAYRSALTRALTRFRTTNDPITAAAVVRAGGLADVSEDQARQLLELAQVAAKRPAPTPDVPLMVALALYRAGRFNEAALQSRQCLNEGVAAPAAALLALSEARRGQFDDARLALKEADRTFARPIPPGAETPLAAGWLPGQLLFLVLRAEAQEIIAKQR